MGLGMLRGESFGTTEMQKYTRVAFRATCGLGLAYLCDFVDMVEELPDVKEFCAMLAKRH